MCVYDWSSAKRPVDVATVVALSSVLKRKSVSDRSESQM